MSGGKLAMEKFTAYHCKWKFSIGCIPKMQGGEDMSMEDFEEVSLASKIKVEEFHNTLSHLVDRMNSSNGRWGRYLHGKLRGGPVPR